MPTKASRSLLLGPSCAPLLGHVLLLLLLLLLLLRFPDRCMSF